MKGILKKLAPTLIACAMIVTTLCSTNVFAKANVHNVTFLYGTKMITQQVKHGKNAVVPTDTDVAGYAFVGWIGNATNVTEDRIILGAYNKDTLFTYATADSNVVVSKYGFPVFQPQPTVKINNNKTAPTPSWWADLNIPKGVPGKTCAVHFYNGWNGEYWKTVMVPYGGSAPDPGNPCLSGFEFVGWEGDWTNVTEDRCIKAWYFVTHEITIIVKSPGNEIDGKVIDKQRIRQNDSIRKNAPYFEGYTFVEYQGKTDNISGSGTVYAVYRK